MTPLNATQRASAVGAARLGPRRFRWLPAAMVGAVAFGVGVLAASLVGRPSAPRIPPVLLRYAMTLPDSASLVDRTGSALAYAPDGSVFAYTSRLGLMLRAADRLDAVPVGGARRGVNPFYSPDGRWLGYLDGTGVLKVPLDSGKVESQGATFCFYVMPYVEGESLRERLVAAGGMGGRPGGRRARLPELPADALRLRALARPAAGRRRGGAGGGG